MKAIKNTIALICLLVIVGSCVGISRNGNRKSAIQEQVSRLQTATRERECKDDSQCWGRRHEIGAESVAKTIIERSARYDYEWTHGTFESIFASYQWLDADQLTVVYVGDAVKMQTTAGAWVRYRYRVEYDTVAGRVLDFAISRGRL